MITKHRTISWSSLSSPNRDDFFADLAAFVKDRAAMPVRAMHEPSFARRRQRLGRNGAAAVSWMCGLEYVRRARLVSPPWRLLAAPVMAGARYERRPIYFSDLIVRADSRYRTWEELRGASFCYNERASFSGYVCLQFELARAGAKSGFFGRVVPSGTHQRSIEWVLAGRVEASGIDSTVLELECARRPRLRTALRVVAAWGPSPIPPLVARGLSGKTLESLRSVLLHMHEQPAGRTLLERAQILRFTDMRNLDYDEVRRKARLGHRVRLGSARIARRPRAIRHSAAPVEP